MQHLNNKEVEHLISLVRVNEIIYNKKHPQYKLQLLKEKAWRKISAAINIPEEHARNAWRSLRDSFVRYSANMKNSNGNVTDCRKPYRYYNALLFLKDTMESKGTRRKSEPLELMPDLSPAHDPLAPILFPVAHDPLASAPLPAAASPTTTSLSSKIPPSPLLSSSAQTTSDIESDTSPLLIPLTSPSANSSTLPKNRQRKKRRIEETENGAQKFLTSLANTLKEDDDEVGHFFNTQAILVRKCNLNVDEFFDLEMCVLKSIRDKLKEMGKI
ncbi:uncharacterized protein LOC119687872 [Teleopsis dalmanni]|uniref:uncharacterized protein LOC119687872 n=1 Tax=Teleopsis dalmanni TaxID=139649 RepID=UPI0018CF29D3|nr:uncharacterized protein LOC119687872 [Teleopsis dalmanni]